jgi:uncharacterized surface protein with fasciclin (FAS1) repeats
MLPIRVLALCVLAAVVSSFSVMKTPMFHNSALNANIFDTAVADGNFKTFHAAAKAAGLVDALSSPGITVFAPTDEAFAKLPEGTLEALLTDIPLLKNILSFHVYPGIMNPTRTGKTLNTLLMGSDNFPKQLVIKVTNWDCVPFVFGGQETPAEVTTMGIKCDNGLIHAINEVLLPYEGDLPPMVTFIGMGGIELPVSLQKGYYGPVAGSGRDPKGIAEKKVGEMTKVGDTWIKACNYDNKPGYWDETTNDDNTWKNKVGSENLDNKDWRKDSKISK